MKIPLTKQQDNALQRVKKGPEERPVGFGTGTPGWDRMMENLSRLGLVEISAPDTDKRVWATITELGLTCEATGARKRGRPASKTIHLGDLSPEQQTAFWEKQRNKT